MWLLIFDVFLNNTAKWTSSRILQGTLDQAILAIVPAPDSLDYVRFRAEVGHRAAQTIT